jgi:DNA-3-methyladenine glycosylase
MTGHSGLPQSNGRAALSPASIEATRGWAETETGDRLRIPPRAYFDRPTQEVARDLLGGLLVTVGTKRRGGSAICGGTIVEVEAYLGERDPACHASRGLTERTRVFYQPGGTAYVFSAYGIHLCFNVITLPAGHAGCVLIRALQPRLGIETMARRRGVGASELDRLCSGPGRLTQALGIRKDLTGSDVTAGPALILLPTHPCERISSGPRVGISVAVDLPLRFWAKDSAWVS